MNDQKNSVTSDAQRLIDDNLKRVYSDVQTEELPDRFKDLLSQLKEQDASRKSGE